MSSLQSQVARLEAANCTLLNDNADLSSRVRGLEDETEMLQHKLEESDAWVKLTLAHMSAAGRAEFIRAATAGKDLFPAGTNTRIRKTVGINLSRQIAPTSNKESELQRAVVSFAEDNSSEVPDAAKAARGVRFLFHYKYVLYEWFLAAQSLSCSYSTFCNYFPSNIVKPKVHEWGTCMVNLLTSFILFTVLFSAWPARTLSHCLMV